MPKSDFSHLPEGRYTGSFDQGGAHARRIRVVLRREYDATLDAVLWFCDSVDGVAWSPDWGRLTGCRSPKAAIREWLWQGDVRTVIRGAATTQVFHLEIEGIPNAT